MNAMMLAALALEFVIRTSVSMAPAASARTRMTPPLILLPARADVPAMVTEVMVGERKVAESRHLVTRASVADMGPTVVWSKSHVPVLQRTGSVELRLSQMGEDGSAQPLFTKTVAYEL